MQFKLSSCFATPSESVVLVVECLVLDRSHAIIPTLHHSSRSVFLFALSSSPVLVIPPHLTTIYTLQQKSSTVYLYQSFLTNLEERTVETNNFSFLFFRKRQMERKGKTRLDSH